MKAKNRDLLLIRLIRVMGKRGRIGERDERQQQDLYAAQVLAESLVDEYKDLKKDKVEERIAKLEEGL